MAGDFVGVIPAAGRGSRLAPFRYSKELLPIAFDSVPGPELGLRPRAVGEYAIACCASAEVDRCFVIVAPWKHEVIHYFADGSDFGVTIAYLYQEVAEGLPRAIDEAYPWLRDKNVVFSMPDTICQPTSCLAQVRSLFEDTESDLTLGVFPTEQADRLGPVVLDGNSVVAVFDKCTPPPRDNTWGVAAWGPRFTELLHTGVARRSSSLGEESIGAYFELAIESNLRVTACYFDDGRFDDVGTPEGIQLFFERQIADRLLSGLNAK